MEEHQVEDEHQVEVDEHLVEVDEHLVEVDEHRDQLLWSSKTKCHSPSERGGLDPSSPSQRMLPSTRSLGRSVCPPHGELGSYPPLSGGL